MERAEWLKQMRQMAEDLYDLQASEYSARFGQYANETQQEYLQKFLGRLSPPRTLLSAACGAGHYGGMLLDAGHTVAGIDQSAGMLAQAEQRCPGARYEKMGLQEMAFREAFDGAICVDAMEHICPEDWPGILQGFRTALKPGGVLYITVELAEASKVEAADQRAKARGLPVVPRGASGPGG